MEFDKPSKESKREVDQLFLMLDEALSEQRDPKKKWEKTEKLYEGDYSPLREYNNEQDFCVKTHLLHMVTEKKVAVQMPPPGFKFFLLAADKDATPDVESSKTGQAILSYLFNKRGGYHKYRNLLTNKELYNRGIAYFGFLPETRPENEEEIVMEDGVASGAMFIDIEDKVPGQAYFEDIDNGNFLIAKGFNSICNAQQPGGWVAARFMPHIDWVKGNEDFNSYKHKIKADVEHKGKIPDSEQSEDVSPADPEEGNAELKYCSLWWMFFWPTKKHPNGRTVVFSYTQKMKLYDFDALPFKGVGFPFREIVDFQGKDFYTTSTSYRSINPLLEHEFFETRIMWQVEQSKNIVILPDNLTDNAVERIEDSAHVAYIDAKDIGPQPPILLPIPMDTDPAANASLRARARFEEMHNIAPFSQARVEGGKIATEMVLRNKIAMTATNDKIISANRFLEEIGRVLLDITKQKCSPEEQVRITRSVEGKWTDNDRITLDGDYVVTVKSNTLHDMSEGDRANVIQMVLSMITQLNAVPGIAGKLNPLPVVKELFEEMSINTEGVFLEMQKEDQWSEISFMLAGLPFLTNPQQRTWAVEPDDNHEEHLKVIEEFMMATDENNVNTKFVSSEDGQWDSLQAIQMHAQLHMQMLQLQSRGARGYTGGGMNQTNALREAGAPGVSSGGEVDSRLSEVRQG